MVEVEDFSWPNPVESKGKGKRKKNKFKSSGNGGARATAKATSSAKIEYVLVRLWSTWRSRRSSWVSSRMPCDMGFSRRQQQELTFLRSSMGQLQ